MKICTKCGKKKRSDKFRKGHGMCLSCLSFIERERHRKYNEEHREEIDNERRIRLEKRKELQEIKKPIRIKRLKLYQKIYRENNKDKIKEYQIKYRKEHIERLRRMQMEYQRKKLKENVEFRIAYSLRLRIRLALHGKGKSARSWDLIGCNINELKSHLEKQFKPGMSWDNWGIHGWHIDHIIPCKSFDLTKPEEQKKCFHYTNMQPLWAKENLSKGFKIIREAS
jgi:hypothetical protein